jgi:hypothetical protein
MAHFFICNSKMVQQVDSRWNHFEADLRLLHSKLVKLSVGLVGNGAIFLDGEATGQTDHFGSG